MPIPRPRATTPSLRARSSPRAACRARTRHDQSTDVTRALRAPHARTTARTSPASARRARSARRTNSTGCRASRARRAPGRRIGSSARRASASDARLAWCAPSTACGSRARVMTCRRHSRLSSTSQPGVPEYLYKVRPEADFELERPQDERRYSEEDGPVLPGYFYGETVPPYVDKLGRAAYLRQTNQLVQVFQRRRSATGQTRSARFCTSGSNYYGPQYGIQTGTPPRATGPTSTAILSTGSPSTAACARVRRGDNCRRLPAHERLPPPSTRRRRCHGRVTGRVIPEAERDFSAETSGIPARAKPTFS